MLWNSPALRTPFREDLPEDEKIAGLSRIWSEAKVNFVYFDRLGGIDWDGLPLLSAQGAPDQEHAQRITNCWPNSSRSSRMGTAA